MTSMHKVTRAGAFVRRSGADGLGHLGWTFQYSDGSYCGGSVENPAGLAVARPDRKGFWSERIVDPSAPLPLLSYDAFKTFEVPDSDAARADSTVAWLALQPYVVLFRNCMDDTYDVLRSYGILALPIPMLELTPNHWFDSLRAESRSVSIPALQEAGLLPRRRVDIDAPTLTPHPAEPPWRTPGTPEWEVFHGHLLGPTLLARMRQRAQDRQSISPAVKPRRRFTPSRVALLAGVALTVGMYFTLRNRK